jgi:hypothetical protein
MKKTIKNILEFYKLNEIDEQSQYYYYLIKNFSNTDNIGLYAPYQKLVYEKIPDKKRINTVDDYNTYKINRYGLRGEFDDNSDILASGCSITFGLGVPELARWSNLLSNKINKSVVNLGIEGASVKSICTGIIQYCMNKKMPKEIFCLFPSFFRNTIVVDKEFYEPSNEESPASDFLRLAYAEPDIDYYKNYIVMTSRNKTYTKNSVSLHQLILDSVNFIYILESFCLTNNIKLYWTTWDVKTNLVMKELLNIKGFKLKKFTPFIPLNSFEDIGDFVKNSCNLDHDSEFKDNICWELGSDYSIIDDKKTSHSAHPGIHTHIHIAELFYNLRKQNNYDKIDV